MQLNKYKTTPFICLLLISFCLAKLGIYCRSYAALSLFWPCNAILLGVLIRFPKLDAICLLPAIYTGMVLADVLSGTPLATSLGLDAANIVFITVGYTVLRCSHTTRPWPRCRQALIRVFPASILAAGACAAVGSIASQHYFHDNLVKSWISWFCEQFSTALLMLPVVIALPGRTELPLLWKELKAVALAPLISLVLSTLTGIYVGGGASLIFPLPALVWCAISYPIFFTCLLTMMTGITEIILVASEVLNIQGTDDFFRIDSLASARLGVAAMTICPLIVALSTTTNKKLVARITKRADYDFLTGTLTRSGLASRLDAMVERRERERQKSFFGAVFLIDIDRFKNINDTYGHAAGDYVLAKTAERIRQTLQQTAIISRMGGEEFLVLAEGISQTRACLLANRLRQSIERNRLILNEQDLSITVSIGISTLSIIDATSLDASIKTADEQLYIAKSSGRNCISPEFML